MAIGFDKLKLIDSRISYKVISHAIHTFRVLIPAVHKKSNVELHFYNDCFHNEHSGGRELLWTMHTIMEVIYILVFL